MEATIRGDGQSTLSVSKRGITIWLPGQVFGEGGLDHRFGHQTGLVGRDWQR